MIAEKNSMHFLSHLCLNLLTRSNGSEGPSATGQVGHQVANKNPKFSFVKIHREKNVENMVTIQ